MIDLNMFLQLCDFNCKDEQIRNYLQPHHTHSSSVDEWKKKIKVPQLKLQMKYKCKVSSSQHFICIQLS